MRWGGAADARRGAADTEGGTADANADTTDPNGGAADAGGRTGLGKFTPCPSMGKFASCGGRRNWRAELHGRRGGGAADTKGLVDFLADRMRVDVSRWNPSEMIEIEALSDAEARQLEDDGCAATIANGLALGAADSNLYALEILTSDAKKRRAFAERGIFHILMGVAAAVYIALSLIVMGGLADDAEAVSRKMRQTQQKNERNHQQALDLIEKINERTVIFSDLRNRQAIGDSA